MAVVASAPGKVLLTGGYLILERPNAGIVLSTNARFYAIVKPVHEVIKPDSGLWGWTDVMLTSPQLSRERTGPCWPSKLLKLIGQYNDARVASSSKLLLLCASFLCSQSIDNTNIIKLQTTVQNHTDLFYGSHICPIRQSNSTIRDLFHINHTMQVLCHLVRGFDVNNLSIIALTMKTILGFGNAQSIKNLLPLCRGDALMRVVSHSKIT